MGGKWDVPLFVNRELNCSGEEIGEAVRELFEAAIAVITNGVPYLIK